MKKILTLSLASLLITNANANKLESIFIVPDVFVTSKLKPTTEYEGERGNILFEGHDLETKRKYSIGDMLKDLPGVSTNGLGNASRPVIRGMKNSRVKILQNGGSTTDVSEFGEDHIVGFDPMLIDKIEIIKGPGTLLYGNNGFAGVVNIINPLIAVDKPITDQNMEANFGYRTSGGELKGSLKASQSVGNFTARLTGSLLSSGPYDLANTSDKQPNSSKFMGSGGVGLTYNDGKNYFGFSLDKLEAVYGNPGPEGEENMTSLNPTKNTFNFQSSLSLNNEYFNKFNLQGTVSEYNHSERTGDGNNHNINFFSDLYEIKTSLNHNSIIDGNSDGLIGFHFQNYDQGALGQEESHLVHTRTSSFALFALESFNFNLFDLDVGGRLESVNLKNTSLEKGFFPSAFSSTIKRKIFNNSNAFAGFDFTERAPNAVELFANGPHHAQEQFEVGQNESISSLMVKSSLLAESLLQTLLNDLETIYESATPQQKRLATYWKQPSIERRIMSWLNDTQQFRQAIRQYGHFGILITIYEELFIVSQLEVADFKHDYKLGSIIFEDQALISVAMNGGFAVVFKSSMVLVNSAVLE